MERAGRAEGGRLPRAAGWGYRARGRRKSGAGRSGSREVTPEVKVNGKYPGQRVENQEAGASASPTALQGRRSVVKTWGQGHCHLGPVTPSGLICPQNEDGSRDRRGHSMAPHMRERRRLRPHWLQLGH
jgi:hypothetical protein